RVERIGMASYQLGTGRPARLLHAMLHNARLELSDLALSNLGLSDLGLSDLGLSGFRHHHAFRLHRPAVGPCLDPDRSELRLRAEPLRRQQGLRRIEAEEFACTVLV